MPDRNRNRIGAGPEFELAYYTKELGKTLQRQMLQTQLARLRDSSSAASRQGEQSSPQGDAAPPAEGGAG